MGRARRTFQESEQETSEESEEVEQPVKKPVPAAALTPKPRAPPPPPQSPGKSKAATKAAANSGAGREPDEMSELYPCLAEEVKAIQKEHPGLFNREFVKIDDSKARALEKKINKEIRKQKLSQMRLRVKVIKTLLDLAE